MIRFKLPGVDQSPKPQTLPLVSFGDRDRQGAPFAKVNSQAGYGSSPGFEAAVREMPPPIASSFLYSAAIKASSISDFVAATPASIWPGTGLPSPRSAWTGLDVVYLSAGIGETSASFCLESGGSSGPRDEATFYVTIEAGVVASKIIVGGATFLLAAEESNPSQGEFVQAGEVAVAYNPSGWTFSPGDVTVFGEVSDMPLTAIAEMAYYSLEGLDLDSIDEVVHLGRSYRRGFDLYSIEIGKFYLTQKGFVLVSEIGKSERAPLAPVPQGAYQESAYPTTTTVLDVKYTREV